jgi:hypothetical protein
VLAEHQVLVCPACFRSALPELDKCVRCDSAHLIRRLDQVECLDCRHVRETVQEPPPYVTAAASPATLADEVARALDRVLGRR